MRITKREYYTLGGPSNPALYRKQAKNGSWQYYMRLDSGFTTLGAVGLMAAFWAIVLIGYGFVNIY